MACSERGSPTGIGEQVKIVEMLGVDVVNTIAEAKVLSNHQATTHWEDIAALRKEYPALSVIEKQRWVDEGNIITSGGISAGIDMSLHLVSKIHSHELAEDTAKKMEFRWSQLS